jgi:hypothetical protein
MTIGFIFCRMKSLLQNSLLAFYMYAYVSYFTERTKPALRKGNRSNTLRYNRALVLIDVLARVMGIYCPLLC